MLVACALVFTVELVLRYVEKPTGIDAPENPFSGLYHAHLVRWTGLRPGSGTRASVGLGTSYEDIWAPSGRSHQVGIGDNGLRLTGPEWNQPVAGVTKTAYRILVIGDSSAFGFFVEDHETYAALLPAVALERGASTSVDALNAGVPGYSIAQGMLFLEELLEDYQPDVVVTAFGTNDARPAGTRWPDRYRNLTDRELLANLEITTGILDTTGLDPWTVVDAVPAGGEPMARLSKTAVYQALKAPLLRVRDQAGGDQMEGIEAPARVPVDEFEAWISTCVDRIRDYGADPVLIAGTVTPAYRAAIYRVHERQDTGLVDAPAVFHSAHVASLADPGGPLAPWKSWVEKHLGKDALRDYPWLLTSIDRVHPGPAGHALLAHAVVSVAAGETGPGFVSGADPARALTLHDPMPVLPLLEIRMLEATGQRSAAIDTLDHILEASPDHPALLRLRGWLSWRGGDRHGAALAWTRAKDQRPTDCDLAIGSVRALIDAGELDRAMDEALRASKECAADPRLRLAIGLVQLERHNYEAAIRHFTEGLRAFPGATGSQLALGRAYLLSGRMETGIETLQRLVHRAPRSGAGQAAISLIPTDRDPDGSFEHEAGLAWLFDVHPGVPRPPLHELSRATILEDGIPLPRSHSHHQQIRDKGEGRFSHWRDVTFFSTTDGTDPNTNGRTYRFVVEPFES